MAQTLEHNKEVTVVVPVTIPTFDDDLGIIQKLDDEPNDVGGLTAAELKAKFDEGNLTAQQYINNVLIPKVVADDLTEQARQAAESERVSNEIERVENENRRVSETEGIVARAERSAKDAEKYANKAYEISGGNFVTPTDLKEHTQDKNNPHAVTAKQSGAVAAGDTYDIKMQGGGVDPIYPRISHHARTITPTSLDDLAWEGKSYREIFEGNNAAYEDFDLNTSSWIGKAEDSPNKKFWQYGDYGGTSVSTSSASGKRSIRFESTNSAAATATQFWSMRRYLLAEGDKLYLAAMLRVSVFSKGANFGSVGYRGCGLNVRLKGSSEGVHAVMKTTTNGFVLCSELGAIPATGEYNLIYGCVSGYYSATCYVDCPVIINLTDLFQNPPDRETMDLLYSNYIALLAKSETAEVSVPGWETGELTAFTDEACYDAFMEEMNKKAAEIGMVNSSFITPSGLAIYGFSGITNVSTTADLARLAAAAIGYPDIGRIWRKMKVKLDLAGPERQDYIISQIIGFSALEASQVDVEGGDGIPARQYLGAKGGTFGSALSFVVVTLSDEGHLLAHAATTLGSSLYPPVRKLTQIAEKALAGEDVSGETVPDVVGAVTLLVPTGATWLFDEQAYRVLYQTGETTAHNPASTSKVLAAMVALDWCPDIRTRTVTMKPLDNVGYSGDKFLMGQSMSMEAAMQAMLMVSSNPAATAIARTVGEVILRSKAARGELIPTKEESSTGNNITVANGADRRLRGLTLYGKTTQNGTPTPDVPVALESPGAGGSITVTVDSTVSGDTPKTLVVTTPNGLPGIPVSSGGNYTDANGQQWVCDTIDFVENKYIKRIGTLVTDASTEWKNNGSNPDTYNLLHLYVAIPGMTKTVRGTLCDKLAYATKYFGTSNSTDANVQSNLTGQSSWILDVDKERWPTLEAWTAWADENPLTVQYILETPVTTTLSLAELAAYGQLRTSYPTTVITNDAAADMTVKYMAYAKGGAE